jgi:hypothetical protein
VGVEGYSDVVLNTMKVAPTLGLYFGGSEKRFKDLLSAIEKDRIGILKMGLLFQILRGRGSGFGRGLCRTILWF